MSLGRIPNVASLRAQAAAASVISIIPLKLSEMTPFGQEAYLSAYAIRESRHGSLRTLSAPAAAVRAGVSTGSSSSTMTGEAAEKIIGQLLRNMFFGLAKYSLIAFLLWCIVVLVNWRRLAQDFGEWFGATLQEIAPQLRNGFAGVVDLFVLFYRHTYHDITHHHRILQVRQAARDRAFQTRKYIDRTTVDIGHYWLFAVMYLHYQRVINWINRHKLHIIAVFVAVHLISTMVRSELNKSPKFIKLFELQRYVDHPIPAYVYWRPMNDGSSSHYRGLAEGLHVSGDTVHRLVESISAPLTTMMPVQEDTALLSQDVAEEMRQIFRDEQIEFCRQCRQDHCCEVYS